MKGDKFMASQLAKEKVAQAWYTPKTKKVVMDIDLAEAFADILDEVWSQPWLGKATTRQLIEELMARVDLDYKTVGYEKAAPEDNPART